MAEELLDLVDDHDRVIGTMLRDEIYSRDLKRLQEINCYIRVINCFVINQSGKLWIPRRTAKKRLFPRCLDASVGGHVQSGESYREALHREALEEVALDCTELTIEELGYLTPPADGVSAFMKVFAVFSEEVSKYNCNDFSEVHWMNPEDLLIEIERGASAKDDLVKLIRKFFYDPNSEKYKGRVKNPVCLDLLKYFKEIYPSLDEGSFDVLVQTKLLHLAPEESLTTMSEASARQLKALFNRLSEDRIVEWLWGIYLSKDKPPNHDKS